MVATLTAAHDESIHDKILRVYGRISRQVKIDLEVSLAISLQYENVSLTE